MSVQNDKVTVWSIFMRLFLQYSELLSRGVCSSYENLKFGQGKAFWPSLKQLFVLFGTERNWHCHQILVLIRLALFVDLGKDSEALHSF